jgi:hypothetical protein
MRDSADTTTTVGFEAVPNPAILPVANVAASSGVSVVNNCAVVKNGRDDLRQTTIAHKPRIRPQQIRKTGRTAKYLGDSRIETLSGAIARFSSRPTSYCRSPTFASRGQRRSRSEG